MMIWKTRIGMVYGLFYPDHQQKALLEIKALIEIYVEQGFPAS
jgi:hypothetical protein